MEGTIAAESLTRLREIQSYQNGDSCAKSEYVQIISQFKRRNWDFWDWDIDITFQRVEGPTGFFCGHFRLFVRPSALWPFGGSLWEEENRLHQLYGDGSLGNNGSCSGRVSQHHSSQSLPL